MITRMSLVALLAMALTARAQQPPQFDWGTYRVSIEQAWPAVTKGISTINPGIAWTSHRPFMTAASELERGWTNTGDTGTDLVGLLATGFELEQTVEVRKFGRIGNRIELVMVRRPTGGSLPGWVQDSVRRKLSLKPKIAVSFDQARTASIKTKRIFFTAAFPQDLPDGEYQVSAELQDELGAVLERYEKRLVCDPATKDPLEKLSDEQLLAEYIRRAEAMQGMNIEPTDSGFPRLAAVFPYDAPINRAWKQTHREIVQRGARMVPGLMNLLETEAVRNPGETGPMDSKFGYASDVMSMLEQIRDPRPVRLLVTIIKGFDGKVNIPIRWRAAETLARLTYTSLAFDSNDPIAPSRLKTESAFRIGSLRPDPKLTELAGQRLAVLADSYTQWLDSDGKAPASWLSLAQQRAHAALKASDPVMIRNAIMFLSGGRYSLDGGHDDRPDETMQTIAKLGRNADPKLLTAVRDYVPIPSALANYGPAARKYIDVVLDAAKQQPLWDSYADLAAIGGERAMAFMVDSLPRLRADLNRLGVARDANRDDLDGAESRNALVEYRACRWGIERWAGRTFDTDDALSAWWRASSRKTQRQWLEENLDRTAGQADAGSAEAQYIIRQVLPDLPHASDDRPFDPPPIRRDPPPYREQSPSAYRVEWLKENRARLTYDERRSCFALPAHP